MTVIAASALWQPLQAKNAIEKYHDEIVELSVEDNVTHPDVPKKQIIAIKNRQLSMARHLKQKGVNVETTRDGLVVVATIPAVVLFAPNDTLLLPKAATQLDLIAHYLKTPDLYKLLVVAHSDNTGSEEYLNALTTNRAEDIVNNFASRGLAVDAVIPYGLGADEPLVPNVTVKNRASNRRVEFYFVPGPEMISQAKAGKL